MGALALVAGAIGSVVSAAGTIAAGDAQKQADDYRAKQLAQQATQAQAAGQQAGFDKSLQEKYVASKLQAGASASGAGAGASDPTVLKLGSDIAGRGEQQALMDMWSGQNQSVGLQNESQTETYSGQLAQDGAETGALGTIIGGIGSGFDKYAKLYPNGLSVG